MPTYEYSCKKCGENLEVFQSFSDKPLKTHKGCGGELKKIFHVRGIVFKGSGFYATDAKGASSTRASTGDSDAKSETSSGSKADSKSQSSSEPKSQPKKSEKTKASASTSD